MGNIDLSRLVFPPNTAGGCRIQHGASRAGDALPALQPPPFHLLALQAETWRLSPAGRSGTWGSTTATGPATASATSSRCTSVGAGGAAWGQRDRGSPPEGVSPFPQGPWVSSPTTCRWPRACSPPSVGAPRRGGGAGLCQGPQIFALLGSQSRALHGLRVGGCWGLALSWHRSCPQSPATTGMESSGSASRTSPWWWRRRPR